LVHFNDVEGASEENLKKILETPIRETKLPLGADVTVSRYSSFNIILFHFTNKEDISIKT